VVVPKKKDAGGSRKHTKTGSGEGKLSKGRGWESSALRRAAQRQGGTRTEGGKKDVLRRRGDFRRKMLAKADMNLQCKVSKGMRHGK